MRKKNRSKLQKRFWGSEYRGWSFHFSPTPRLNWILLVIVTPPPRPDFFLRKSHSLKISQDLLFLVLDLVLAISEIIWGKKCTWPWNMPVKWKRVDIWKIYKAAYLLISFLIRYKPPCPPKAMLWEPGEAKILLIFCVWLFIPAPHSWRRAFPWFPLHQTLPFL